MGGFLLSLAVLLPGAGASPAQDRAGIEHFERKIRPVLVDRCYRCHSSGAERVKGGLLLDTREGLLKGGSRGVAVVPGDPDRSLLIQAIRHTDPELKMPPKRKLSPQQIADFEAWIKRGVPDPRKGGKATRRLPAKHRRHWAFIPPKEHPLPDVKAREWPRTPIDRFILAGLEAKGLAPSPAADKRTLLRRAAFDLIGLPPAPEEADAFLTDDDPKAYERLVERLLDSPHYGERWGRHWLDIARYADNKGYIFFGEKSFPWSYTYRDYVVRAFNEDLPYDRFVLEQLAADQLDLGKDKRALAAMGFLTLGGRFMNNLHDILDDRIDVVTRGFMGLTVTCARCHDHKFDPIPQADYYSLYGVFRSSMEPLVPPLFAPPPSGEEYRAFDRELEKRIANLDAYVRRKREELATSARDRAAEYLLAAETARHQPSMDQFMLLTEKGGLNPTMVIQWKNYLERTARGRDRVWAPWHLLAAIPEKRFAAEAAEAVRRMRPNSVNPLVVELFSTAPASMEDLAARYGKLLGRIDRKWRRELEEAAGDPPVKFCRPEEEELRRVLYGPAAAAEVPPAFGWGFLALLPDRPAQKEYKDLLKAVETHSIKGKGAPPRAMVLVDSPTLNDPRIFIRGNPNRPGRAVPRRFLEAIAGPDRPSFTRGSGRLELARAIVDPANPVTARVLVNRVWQLHFGEGLVRTPSDFGVQGVPPTHPGLLDHLAVSFMKDGWSIKRLHRRIMLSSVYRQSGGNRPEAARADPENVLLWRFPRRRLDFESLRDSLLAVSGRLDRTIGGKPENLWSDSMRRRTIYAFVDRMDLDGMRRAFDFPDPAATSPRRSKTTVSPQALFLMNSDFAWECARRLAGRPEVAAGKGVGALYRILFARNPDPEEVEMARKFLANGGEWMQYVHALLMTNEFVFVD